jgi:hypothetical protein
VAAVVVPAAFGPSAPAGAAPGTPQAPAGPVSACTLGGDLGPSCLSASAHLTEAVARGGRTTLKFEVKSQIDLRGVRVQVDLPAPLDWQSGPAGFTVERFHSALPGDGGQLTRASAPVDLAAGKPVKYEATLAAVGTGDVAVRVRAVAPAGMGRNTEVPVLATIGADRASSSLGLPKGPVGTVPVPPGTAAVPANPGAVPDVGTRGLATPHSDDPGAGGIHPQAALACVRGSFNYLDPAGATRPSINLQVQVWDSDTIGDDLLAVGLTDGSGGYHICFDNSTDVSGGQDVYLRFVTENGQWGVQNDDDPFVFTTEVHSNVGNGTTVDFGGRQPADPRFMGALRVFDDANAAAAFVPGECWAARDHDCRVIEFNWDPASTRSTAYNQGNNQVSLLAQDADDRNVVVHELGHGVMDDVYADNFPSTGRSCQQHVLHLANTRECAWTEGFADWFGVAVFNDPTYRDTGDQTITQSFDTPTWGSVRQDTGDPWQNGDNVEGRVAGAIWDLVDGPGEPVWDRYGEGLQAFWDSFTAHRANNFAQYWQQRGADGRNVGPDALAALYQNTIDYQFRDPLASQQALIRPMPVVPHNYRFDTATPFWSVVALRPPATSDYDLYLYDDVNLTQQLSASLQLDGVTDFVAVDSNHRAFGDYYPQVRAVTGTGDYVIEEAETSGLLADTNKVAMGPNRLVTVWDYCTATPGHATFTVTPSDPGQDAELFVMGSDAGRPDTLVRSRGQALADSTGAGPGGTETVGIDLGADCYGIVLINKAGNGTYTLTRT